MICETYGLEISCIDEGDRTNSIVFLLHGWDCEIEVYRPIINVIKQKYRIVVPQLPGFGKSDSPPSGWTMQEYTEFVLDFIKSYHVDKVILIGHSMGTRIMIRLSTQYKLPFVIEKMVFINGAGILPIRLQEYLSDFNSFQQKKKQLVANGDDIGLAQLRSKADKDYAYMSDNMCITYESAVTDNLEAFLKQIKVPTLLIWGQNDKDTPVEDGKKMKRYIPGSALIVLKNAGHYSFLDSPFAFSAILKSYLEI